MTGTELRIALSILRMKQKDFGAVVGITEWHVSRWIHDRAPIPRAVELVVNTMVEKHNAFNGSNTHLSLLDSSPEDAAQ